MLDLLRKHKIVVITILADLILFWLLFYSGLVVPWISPSLEEYNASGTSFPRNYNQILLWFALHLPSSLLIESARESIKGPQLLLSLCTIQTGFIALFIQKAIQGKRNVQ
ncbi:MAG: hypothetical protein N2484_02985 [Clostridia bacterium]|nr:hypothetical protein [Clostridia bacterium]